MGKFLKQGRVVIVLRGRFAGRKAVIVKSFDEGAGSRKFGHCLVAGIDIAPKKVTRSMSEKQVKKRSTIRPFVKAINYNHLMPTRYKADLELKNLETGDATKFKLDEEALNDAGARELAKKAVKKVLQEGYFAQNKRKNAKMEEGVKYFYEKLRF